MQQCKDKSKMIMGAIIVILLIVVFYSLGFKDSDNVTTNVATTAVEKTEPTTDNVQESLPKPLAPSSTDTEYVIDVNKSDLKWFGYKIVPVTTHFGNIKLKQGSIYQDADGHITAGKFVIDMKSITNDDLEDQAKNAKIIKHLGSDAFFNSAQYPEAVLEITNAKALPEGAGDVNYQLAGNLTIKGITHNISFPAAISVENGILTAQAKVDFDRTLWDIRFGSLKFGPDAIVKDVITLNVSLVANQK